MGYKLSTLTDYIIQPEVLLGQENLNRLFIDVRLGNKLEEELKDLIASKPEEIRNYIYLSEVLTQSGNREKAIEILIKAKSISSSNAMVRLALADHYKALKQYENTFIELKVAFAEPRY